MKTLKTMQVIMLPTDKPSDIHMVTSTNRLVKWHTPITPSNELCINQFLYLVSNEEIKEGDWFINEQYFVSDKIEYAIWQHNGQIKPNSNPKKIEATTDSSLIVDSCPNTCVNLQMNHCGELCTTSIPQIPQSFVEAYAKSGGTIKEVQVEMEHPNTIIANNPVKTRPDNTVIIHPSKTYTREEMIKIVEEAIDIYAQGAEGDIEYNGLFGFQDEFKNLID